MRRNTRKRLIAAICYLLATSLSFAPVAHASSAMYSGFPMQAASLGQHCDQDPGASGEHSHSGHSNGAADANCEHGSACEILCSASLSILNDGDTLAGMVDSNRWKPTESRDSIPTFSFRLDKPPRT